MRPEDFVDLKLLGVGTYGQVRAVQHTPTRAMMARKVRHAVDCACLGLTSSSGYL